MIPISTFRNEKHFTPTKPMEEWRTHTEKGRERRSKKRTMLVLSHPQLVCPFHPSYKSKQDAISLSFFFFIQCQHRGRLTGQHQSSNPATQSCSYSPSK